MKRFTVFAKTATAIALTAASILSAAAFTSCSKKEKLYLYNWTYYTPKALIKKFEKEFDCKVKLDTYSTCDEMYAKLRGGAKGYDIVIPSNDFVSIMIQQDMLMEIDQSKFTNRANINPAILKMTDYDPEMKYAVPYALSATGVMVNKNKVKNQDYARDYSIFGDKQFAEHATMMDELREVIGCALLHLGYDMNSRDKAELAEAYKLISSDWKPNLSKFDAESFGKGFSSGDFWLSQGYPEIVYQEIGEERWENEVDFFIPPEGSPATIDSMVILKNSRHYELANEFINFIHRPENYAVFIDEFLYPCVANLAAMEYVTKKPMYAAEQAYTCTLKQDLGTDLDKYTEIWEKIRFSD